jgi:hypothetical protein
MQVWFVPQTGQERRVSCPMRLGSELALLGAYGFTWYLSQVGYSFDVAGESGRIIDL